METTKFLVGKLLYRFGAGFITFTFEEWEGIECREYFAVPQGDVYKKHYVGQVWSGGYKMVVGKQLLNVHSRGVCWNIPTDISYGVLIWDTTSHSSRI